MRIGITAVAVALTGPCVLGASGALAADYHVAPPPAGSDTSGDGSAAKPWATVGHAASSVTAGDTVHVAPGTYAEAVVATASGTSSARITFVSDVPWGAKIDASGHYTAWETEGDWVDIVGFDVTGADYLGVLNLGSNVRIVGNHVHHLATPTCNSGNGGAAIDHGDYTKHDNDTVGNFVDHVADQLTGCNQIQGIYHANARGHVWNNVVGQIGAYCIHNWHASTDVVISNNLVFGCKSGGIIVGDGDAPGGVVADNFVVANNVVLDSAIGIREYGSYGTHNTYVDNLVYGCATPLLLTNADTGTLTVDPKLVRYALDATGDYHLAAGSPCIDHGTSNGAPAFDFAGAARPSGPAFDIGPFEYGAVAGDAGAGTDAGSGAGTDAGADDGGGGGDAGSGSDAGGATGEGASGDGSSSSGCGCAVVGARGGDGLGLGLGVALALALGRVARSFTRRSRTTAGRSAA